MKDILYYISNKVLDLYPYDFTKTWKDETYLGVSDYKVHQAKQLAVLASALYYRGNDISTKTVEYLKCKGIDWNKVKEEPKKELKNHLCADRPYIETVVNLKDICECYVCPVCE